MKPFEIEITSSAPAWSLHNVTLTAEGVDSSGNRCGRGFYAVTDAAGAMPDRSSEWEAVLQARDCWGREEAPAPVLPQRNAAGQQTASPAQEPRSVRLTTDPCAALHLYIYAIPHTLPEGDEVQEYPDFPVRLTVRCGGATIHSGELFVNAWSGCSARFVFTAE